MANTANNESQIDRLVLDITVQDGKGRESSTSKISALDKALSQFQSTVKSLDITGFKSKFASMASALKPFVDKLKQAQESLKLLNSLSKRMGVSSKSAAGTPTVGKENVKVPASGDGTMPKAQQGIAQQLAGFQLGGMATSVTGYTQSLNELTETYGKLRKQITEANGVTPLFFENFENGKKITQKFTAQLDKSGNVIKNSMKEVNKTADDVSGNGLKAFFLSIKRIALYRSIRLSLRILTKMFKEGIANVASFDETTRHAMSEISSSFTVIKNSVGLVFKPLIELVAPFIRSAARIIGEIANAISYMTAQLRGQNRVLKVNIEYFEEMNQQAHLLDFDQFSVLSNMDQASNMFEEVPIEEMDAYYEDHKGILATVEAISALLMTIGGLKLVKWIIGGGIGKLLGKISPIAIAIAGIGEVIMAIDDIVNWDETTSGLQKVMNVLTVVLGTIAAIAGIVAAFLPTGAAKIAKAVAFGAALAGLVTMTIGKAQAHADGGMFEGTGTMYHLAGESGAEIVAKGSRGTGVVNIDQFTVAMVNALSEYGAAQKDSTGAPMVVQLDGREIARAQVRNNANELMRNYNIELKPR